MGAASHGATAAAAARRAGISIMVVVAAAWRGPTTDFLTLRPRSATTHAQPQRDDVRCQPGGELLGAGHAQTVRIVEIGVAVAHPEVLVVEGRPFSVGGTGLPHAWRLCMRLDISLPLM